MKKQEFVFHKRNMMYFVCSVILLCTGYFLMALKTKAGLYYLHENIFHNRVITIAPIMIILGYIVMIIAIMVKPGKNE